MAAEKLVGREGDGVLLGLTTAVLEKGYLFFVQLKKE